MLTTNVEWLRVELGVVKWKYFLYIVVATGSRWGYVLVAPMHPNTTAHPNTTVPVTAQLRTKRKDHQRKCFTDFPGVLQWENTMWKKLTRNTNTISNSLLKRLFFRLNAHSWSLLCQGTCQCLKWEREGEGKGYRLWSHCQLFGTWVTRRTVIKVYWIVSTARHLCTLLIGTQVIDSH